MLKKTAIAITVLAATTLSTGAMAKGGFRHHVPFVKIYVDHGYGHYRHGHRHWRSCYRFKKRYIRTGNRYWLKRYRVCRVLR